MRQDELRVVPRQVTSSPVTTHRDASRSVAIRHDASRRITFATCHEASPHVATRHDASRRIMGRDRACAVFTSWCLPGGPRVAHARSDHSGTDFAVLAPLASSSIGNVGFPTRKRRFGTHGGPSLTGVGAKRASFGWFSGSPGRDWAILGQILPFWLLQGGSVSENDRFMVGKRRF